MTFGRFDGGSPAPLPEVQEGRLAVPGGAVWYRIIGASNPGVPLLGVHGGPGYPSTDLMPLEALASSENRPVVVYDQFGCGNSGLPDQDSVGRTGLWTVERSVEELAAVREGLNLDEMHLLGLSWGGTLAAEYMMTRAPRGIASLTLASPMLSASRFREGLVALASAIAPTAYPVLVRGDTESPEYQRFFKEFEARFILGKPLEDFPPDQRAALEASEAGFGAEVNEAMVGKSEFNMTGPLGSLERLDALHRIGAQVLYICGRNDYITPGSVDLFRAATPGSGMIAFRDSAHMAHFTQSDRYLSRLGHFLRTAESRR